MAGRAKHSDGAFTGFLRILLQYPEILAWEYQYRLSREEMLNAIYGTVKAIKAIRHLSRSRNGLRCHSLHCIGAVDWILSRQSEKAAHRINDFNQHHLVKTPITAAFIAFIDLLAQCNGRHADANERRCCQALTGVPQGDVLAANTPLLNVNAGLPDIITVFDVASAGPETIRLATSSGQRQPEQVADGEAETHGVIDLFAVMHRASVEA